MADPVRLTTERLVLDAHTEADFPAVAALWADPLVVRHISGQPSSAQESWMRLLRHRGLWALLGYGTWAVRNRSGAMLGEIGFADFHRGAAAIEGVPEAGWVFAPGAQGKGYAGEALGAALAWLDQQAFGARSVCLVAPANERSLRLATAHGYADAQEVACNGPSLLLSRSRPGTVRPQLPDVD